MGRAHAGRDGRFAGRAAGRVGGGVRPRGHGGGHLHRLELRCLGQGEGRASDRRLGAAVGGGPALLRRGLAREAHPREVPRGRGLRGAWGLHRAAVRNRCALQRGPRPEAPAFRAGGRAQLGTVRRGRAAGGLGRPDSADRPEDGRAGASQPHARVEDPREDGVAAAGRSEAAWLAARLVRLRTEGLRLALGRGRQGVPAGLEPRLPSAREVPGLERSGQGRLVHGGRRLLVRGPRAPRVGAGRQGAAGICEKPA